MPILWREQRATWHARSCVAAIALSHAGLCAFFAFLLGASADWGMLAIKLGTFGFSLMIFFTVAHRMFAFFAGNVVPRYVPWRPMWLLAAVWAAAAVRLIVWIAEAQAWLWIPDAALLGLSAFPTWRWWPRGPKPDLLAMLWK